MLPPLFSERRRQMYGTLKIGNKDVEMVANGATPFWFNQIFHEDFFTEASKLGDGGVTANVFIRVAFVMAKQATAKDMKKVNEGQFLDWLAEFDAMDLPNALEDIITFYQSQTEGTSTPKK